MAANLLDIREVEWVARQILLKGVICVCKPDIVQLTRTFTGFPRISRIVGALVII